MWSFFLSRTTRTRGCVACRKETPIYFLEYTSSEYYSKLQSICQDEQERRSIQAILVNIPSLYIYLCHAIFIPSFSFIHAYRYPAKPSPLSARGFNSVSSVLPDCPSQPALQICNTTNTTPASQNAVLSAATLYNTSLLSDSDSSSSSSNS